MPSHPLSAIMPEALSETTVARAARHLARRDRDLADILKTLGPPPLWARPPGFSTLVKIILEQQVSLASAAALFARLKKNTTPFRPARMIELGEPHLQSLGLTRQKAAYCLHLAESLTTKRLRLSQLSRMSDADVRAALMEIKGLGAWSADVYLLMVLRRPDIFPATDLALVSAVTDLKQLSRRPDTTQLLKLAEGWRPYRSVAARMLWQYYLAQRNGTRHDPRNHTKPH
ncbi:MAG: DNA-3-methyladenine glycosylase family protein [Pyrinomonadaceae bacterium]